ncbi:hypothetical protein FHT26_005673 [Rhizobacter sp. SG703]|nr:hypothetical protein [Rhizobacter sp. SG703]
MNRVGPRSQIVRGSHAPQAETLSDWLKSLDMSKVPRKVRQEIEHLGPAAHVPSKAAQMGSRAWPFAIV